MQSNGNLDFIAKRTEEINPFYWLIFQSDANLPHWNREVKRIIPRIRSHKNRNVNKTFQEQAYRSDFHGDEKYDFSYFIY